MIIKYIIKRCLKDTPLKREIPGFTIVEVILAIVILTITTTVIMNFLLAGERVYNRSILIEKAAGMAQNEAELIKAQAPEFGYIENRNYNEKTGARTLRLEREINNMESIDSLIGRYTIREIEIRVVEEKSPEDTLVTFKFIQGYDIK